MTNMPEPYSSQYQLEEAKQLLLRLKPSSTHKLPSTQHWPDCPQPSLLQDMVRIQHCFGFINKEAVKWLAQVYHSSPSEINGIIAFYSFLQNKYCGKYIIHLSSNITDEMEGVSLLFSQFEGFFRLSTPDLGSVTLSACIGLSDQGPAGLINGYPLTHLSAERVREITALMQAQKPLYEWPARFFKVEDNVYKRGLLLNHQIHSGSVLTKVLKRYSAKPEEFISVIQQASLRGRGGAGFSTATKWQACRQSDNQKSDDQDTQRVVVCNADEGEPGTFKDRVLLSSYLENVIEGMTICAFSIGAQTGYLYLRGEYIYLQPLIQQHLEQRRQKNLLGKNILGTLSSQAVSFDFDIYLHVGAGAYICGEETALLESLEGKRGIPRIRPPYPVSHGFLQRPTVVNNVETFCCVTWIADHSADDFSQLGNPGSTGTKIHSTSGDCTRPGLYELSMGTPVSTLLTLCAAENKLSGVQAGGPSGRFLKPDQFDLAMDYDHVSSGGSFMIFNESRALLDIAENFTCFFQHESCGLCTSCRVGTGILVKYLRDLKASGGSINRASPETREIQSLARLINTTSHCGLGHSAGNPALQHLPELISTDSPLKPYFDTEKALPDFYSSEHKK